MTTMEWAAQYYEKIMEGTATDEDIMMYEVIRSTSWLNHDFFDKCVKSLVMGKINNNDKGNDS